MFSYQSATLCGRCLRATRKLSPTGAASPVRFASSTTAQLRPSHGALPTLNAPSYNCLGAQSIPRPPVLSTSRHTIRAQSTSASSPSTAPPSPSTDAFPHAPGGPEKPDYLDSAESTIWDRLAAEFAPAELEVRDISGGCGSMYGIEIASDKFRGANTLKQQRMVNAVLKDLMTGWHGVQLKTRVP